MDSCVSGNHNLPVGKMGPTPKCEFFRSATAGAPGGWQGLRRRLDGATEERRLYGLVARVSIDLT
jgi:hypothetical protein